MKNFQIQRHYQKESKFNGIYSRNNFLNKRWPYAINLDQYESIGTHWIALYVNRINKRASHDEIYFDSFWVKHIPKEIKKFIRKKNIITNIYKIQTYVSIVGKKNFIGFVDFVLRGWNLLALYKFIFL